MKIRIIKSILSIYGAMVPGMEISVPEHIAKNWAKNGIAESLEAPAEIPAGMFWCGKHQALHKLASRPGKSCLKRIEAEKRKAKEAEEKAAQEKAEAEAEVAAEEARVAKEAELAGIGEKNARADGEPEHEPGPPAENE